MIHARGYEFVGGLNSQLYDAYVRNMKKIMNESVNHHDIGYQAWLEENILAMADLLKSVHWPECDGSGTIQGDGYQAECAWCFDMEIAKDALGRFWSLICHGKDLNN